MVRFTAALLKLTTTNLREIALALKAGVKEESNYRRIRRFLSGHELDFVMLGRLLVKLPSGKASAATPALCGGA